MQPPFALALTPVAAQAVAAAESAEEEEQIKVLKARTIPPPPPFLREEFASPTAEQPTADQLLASQDEHAMPAPGLWNDAMLQMMALSEEERLALVS